MFALIPLQLMALTIFAVLTVVALTRTPREIVAAGARPWLARSRTRSWVALAAAVGVGAASVAWHAARPDLLGLPLALAPGGAAVGAFVAFALVPAARPPYGSVTAAALTPRRPWSYGRRLDFVLTGGLAAISAAVLLFTGFSSSADEQGRFRQISLTDPPLMVSHGPYPGWWYAVPLLLMTVVLLAAIWTALVRIAGWPAPPVPGLEAVDTALRRASTRVVTGLGSAAMLGYLGGVLLFAGSGLLGVARGLADNGAGPHPVWLAGGVAATVLGVVSTLASVAGAALAALAAVRLPVRSASTEPDRVPA